MILLIEYLQEIFLFHLHCSPRGSYNQVTMKSFKIYQCDDRYVTDILRTFLSDIYLPLKRYWVRVTWLAKETIITAGRGCN